MPLRRWFVDLPRRVAPLLVWVTIVGLLMRDGITEVITFAAEYFESDGWIIFFTVLFLLAITLVIAWVAFWIVRAVLRRMPRLPGIIFASLAIIACVASIAITGYVTDRNATVSPVFVALGVLLGCALVIAMGGGALISWAARMAVRNASAVGNMASLALPVILMLVVFSFFATELWQMGTALTGWSLLLVGLFVGALAVAVVLQVCAAEIDEMGQTLTREQRSELLVGTPAQDRVLVSDIAQPLLWPQRVNILLVMATAQLLQALFFAALLWALLVTLGAIAVPSGLVSLWIGSGSAETPMRVEYVTVAGSALPITVNLLKTSALLALIAALPFVFSAVSEERYRERFFDPIMADMRRAVVVRDALTEPRKPRRLRGRGDGTGEVRTSAST